MRVINGYNMEEAYTKAIEAVLNEGEVVSPRGSKTYEIAPATIVIENARQILAAPTPRKINPCFGIAETLWFLRGSDDLEEIAHYNSVWRYFEDEDVKGKLNGAYGKRLRKWNYKVDQLMECYYKLKKDPYSRQAICIIYDPEKDNRIHTNGNYSKDIPCTSYFNFHIRNGKLNMHVVMRSNDLHKGFIYDAHNFMMIQNIMAGWLGVEVGKYTHTASSLHIYEPDKNNLIDCVTCDDYSIYSNIKDIPKIGVSLEEWKTIFKNITFIEEYSREIANDKFLDKDILKTYLRILNTKLNYVDNKFWKAIGACLMVYNLRKARLPKYEWEHYINRFIKGTEYYPLFSKLTDLSDTK